MSKRLFNLRNVSDEEAGEVRALLSEQGLDWYETPPSPWGISHGALWLSDAGQYARARALLDEYQRQRGERVRREHAQALAEGHAPTFRQLLRARPVFVISTLGVITVIVVLTLALPWLLFG